MAPDGRHGTRCSPLIFKEVRDHRPYPDHGFSTRDWAGIPPRQVRLSELVTTKKVLALDKLLEEDSTFFGDLFPHVVAWRGEMYLEDGMHRALRAALHQRHVLHVRVLDLDELSFGRNSSSKSNGTAETTPPPPAEPTAR